MVTRAIRIQISPKDPVAKNIEHAIAFIEMDDKRFFLERFIKQHEDQKILVFVRTKVRAERVKKAMERVDILSDTIHSDREQKERKSVMQGFRSGDLKILIATDVSARGIDIPNVEYVINYDMPQTGENYVHRVGRTGRGSQKGQALSFCAEEEKPVLAEIEENLGKPIQRMEVTNDDYQYTLDISDAKANNWQQLIKDADKEKAEFEAKRSKRRKKR